MATNMSCFQRFNACVLPNSQLREAFGRFRQAVALPLYAVALVLDYLSDALSRLTAWIADDDWP